VIGSSKSQNRLRYANPNFACALFHEIRDDCVDSKVGGKLRGES